MVPELDLRHSEKESLEHLGEVDNPQVAKGIGFGGEDMSLSRVETTNVVKTEEIGLDRSNISFGSTSGHNQQYYEPPENMQQIDDPQSANLDQSQHSYSQETGIIDENSQNQYMFVPTQQGQIQGQQYSQRPNQPQMMHAKGNIFKKSNAGPNFIPRVDQGNPGGQILEGDQGLIVNQQIQQNPGQGFIHQPGMPQQFIGNPQQGFVQAGPQGGQFIAQPNANYFSYNNQVPLNMQMPQNIVFNQMPPGQNPNRMNPQMNIMNNPVSGQTDMQPMMNFKPYPTQVQGAGPGNLSMFNPGLIQGPAPQGQMMGARGQQQGQMMPAGQQSHPSPNMAQQNQNTGQAQPQNPQMTHQGPDKANPQGELPVNQGQPQQNPNQFQAQQAQPGQQQQQQQQPPMSQYPQQVPQQQQQFIQQQIPAQQMAQFAPQQAPYPQQFQNQPQRNQRPYYNNYQSHPY
jgi:hypothetical protein